MMLSNPIANHKTFCCAMSPEGWSYGGFDEGFYLFQKGNYQDGFKEMKCLEEDLTQENLQRMVQLGVTR